MKLNKLVVSLLCVGPLCAPAAMADDLRQALLSCAAQGNYVARLDCYDGLAREQQKAAALAATAAENTASGDVLAAPGAVTASAGAVAATSQQLGKWRIVQRDGQVTIRTQDTPLTLGGVGTATLTLQCQQGKAPTLAIDWGFDLGSNVYLAVSTPHSKAQRSVAKMSADTETTYYTKPVVALLQQMLTDDYLEAYADAGNKVLRGRFMMAGFDQALAAHRQVCGL